MNKAIFFRSMTVLLSFTAACTVCTLAPAASARIDPATKDAKATSGLAKILSHNTIGNEGDSPISGDPPCPGVTCPAGSIQEAEPCGHATNNGCLGIPEVFEIIIGNATICGTVFATDINNRDTDWYAVTAPASGRITATITPDFSAIGVLFDFGTPIRDACSPFELLQRFPIVPCATGTLTASGLVPGNTYVIIVAPQAVEGLPCANYILTVDQSDAGTTCCDFDRDGVLSSQDFFEFLGAFFAMVPAADFNEDDFVNSQDAFDFLACFFSPPAGCT